MSEGLIADQIHARLIEQSLVMDELPFELGFGQLKRARIDLRQKIALLDDLAFLEADFDELAIDLGPDRHGCDGRHGAETASPRL